MVALLGLSGVGGSWRISWKDCLRQPRAWRARAQAKVVEERRRNVKDEEEGMEKRLERDGQRRNRFTEPISSASQKPLKL
jgi:hypothetical protein